VKDAFDFRASGTEHVDMKLTLQGEDEALIGRLMATGKFENEPEVVRAGLKQLEENALHYVPVRPAGYFAADYGMDEERLALEEAASKVILQPER
jgi:Arc/MetJ-type ribon-helix-helix transcriptional regulator